MKKYKIDENTIWEETGRVKVHNYPASPMTYSYVTKIYNQIERNKFGCKEVEGRSLYFHEMSPDEVSFAKIMTEAENSLYNKIYKLEEFSEIEDEQIFK